MLAKALVTFYLMAFLMGGLMQAAPVKNARAASVSGCGQQGPIMGLSASDLSVSDSFRARWKNIYPVTLSYQGKCTAVFRDSGIRGTFLWIPINGDGVFVVKPEVLEAMLPEEKKQTG